jgi:ABC-type lipoprotein release transport system permease subunit
MPVGNLARMVVANTLRSRRHFILSAFGIVIGIATFVVFLASTEQVAAVLEKIFPVEEVEVIPPHVKMVAMDTKRLDDATVKTITARREVARVIPRMSLAFPAFGTGTFNDAEISLDISGAADGIDPAYVLDDPTLQPDQSAFFAGLFKDWELDKSPHTPCFPPKPDGASTCPRPDRYYCDRADYFCHHRVPVVLSPTMLQLYNTQYAKAHNSPLIGEDFGAFIKLLGLERLRFTLQLGTNAFAKEGEEPPKRREVEAVVIGISNKAKRIGMTVPLGYIQRWNTEFKGEDAGKRYSSLVVTLEDRDRLGMFSQWLQDTLDLRVEDSLGENFAIAIFVIRLVLVIISLVIIAISAINIAHNFFMQVTERRRELGLLRAVGATRLDVELVVLGEAALIGLIGGVLGVLLGLGLAFTVDWGSAHYLPNFPFKPDTWFHFRWWIIAGGLGCAAGFAVLGGYLPARRASRMEPAQALTQN